MGEKIAFENGRISDFQGFVTLTLDRVILHTVMHHSSTSTYTANFYWNRRKFVGGRTLETGFIRSTRRSRSKNGSRLTTSRDFDHAH